MEATGKPSRGSPPEMREGSSSTVDTGPWFNRFDRRCSPRSGKRMVEGTRSNREFRSRTRVHWRSYNYGENDKKAKYERECHTD